ncbi:hypothetical protein L3X38_037538 [Prunus dulcis]|uniref:Uncharacterized protein n=1 Tax=Prunus dulcis TaxID=3755 RepID=A0AAD4V4V3_PRUDU|nr:hypothetical protein L3X38_037538 [Prunus dulcis]
MAKELSIQAKGRNDLPRNTKSSHVKDVRTPDLLESNLLGVTYATKVIQSSSTVAPPYVELEKLEKKNAAFTNLLSTERKCFETTILDFKKILVPAEEFLRTRGYGI